MSFESELNYLSLIEQKENILAQRLTISSKEIDSILKEYHNVPLDFINYLKVIGAGNILNSQFKIYNNLTDFLDLGLDNFDTLPEGIKLFGDNFSGDFSGFDLSKEITDEVIEFWHNSSEIHYTGKTFREYIRGIILMTALD
jgi:hypothetical protein